MASTYGNDLRLEEIGDGEQSGTWGATTNTNLELIAEALSFGTEAITTNADTHTTTIADGATDPGRSLYLKYTGTLDSTCTITIAPNSISKTWYIENGTSGSQSIIISQGSGANVTIPTGQTKIVYSDGAGSGAAMAEIGTLGVTNLNVSGDITVGDDLTVTDDAAIGGALTVTGVLTGTSLDISGNVDIDGTLETDALSINSAAVTSTAAELNILDGVTATTAELNIMDGVTSTTAELNILDGVTSTAAELNQLDAITRGSILYGNASGATARLAKGGADTVLTSDGTDISWAAAGGGGGEQTFTATGAISAGDIVGLNSNGTISVSEAVLQAAVAHGGASGGSVVYDTVNDKVLYFYRGTNSYLYGRVGTIANGQISFGTAAASASVTVNYVDAAFDTNAGKAVVVYNNDGGNNYPYAVVATVSGTNISFGTPVVMKSEGQYRTRVLYDSNAQKVLCTYHGNLYNEVRGRVGTVSGTSISFGTESDISSANAAQYNSNIGFDSNVNKFLLVYQQANQTWFNVRVLTISGTSISGGTEIRLQQGSSNSLTTSPPTVTFIPNINKFAVFWNYSTNAYYAIITIDGTSVEINISNVLYSATGGNYGAGYNGAAYITIAGDKEIFNFSDGTYESFIPVKVAAEEIVFGPLASRTRWGAGTSSDSVYDPDAGAVINVDASNTRISNVTAPSFVGIAAENISNGATGTVTVVGGINTAVSGLTSGKEYGLPSSSATISEIGVSGEGAFGVALSSSSIYLNAGKI